MFHISCLIQWVLLFEIVSAKQSEASKLKPKSRKKVKGKNGQKPDMQGKQIASPFCPECQGTGIPIDGDELEKPPVPLSEVHYFLLPSFAYLKLKFVISSNSLGFFLLGFSLLNISFVSIPDIPL